MVENPVMNWRGKAFMNLDFDLSSEFLKAMAHPTRLRILCELKTGKRCVTDMTQLLEISQPNLSQHLTILRKEKIIGYHEEGNRRCYYIINPEFVRPILALLKKHL
jgi:ArsR family transcriptional regulator